MRVHVRMHNYNTHTPQLKQEQKNKKYAHTFATALTRVLTCIRAHTHTINHIHTSDTLMHARQLSRVPGIDIKSAADTRTLTTTKVVHGNHTHKYTNSHTHERKNEHA